MRPFYLLLACGALACGGKGDAGPSSTLDNAAAPAAQTGSCGPVGIERIEVSIGQTARTVSGLAVTFAKVSAPEHEDSPLTVELVFQGVGEGGELTPSALTWRSPEPVPAVWHYLPVGYCVHVVEKSKNLVVLDLVRGS